MMMRLLCPILVGSAAASRLAQWNQGDASEDDAEAWSLKVDFGLDQHAELKNGRARKSGNLGAYKLKYVPVPGFERMDLSQDERPPTQHLRTHSGVTVALNGIQWAMRYANPTHALFGEAAVCWENCNMTLGLAHVPPGDYMLTLYHVVPRRKCGKCFSVDVSTKDGTLHRWTRTHDRGLGSKDEDFGQAAKTWAHVSVGKDGRLDISMAHDGEGTQTGKNKWDKDRCSHCYGCDRCGYGDAHMALNGLELTRDRLPRVRPYKESDAMVYAKYAQASFCDEEAVKAWNCGPPCDAVRHLMEEVRYIGPGREYKVVGFVARQARGHCVVVYRGSASSENWNANLLVHPRKWPKSSACVGCKTHAGIGKAYEELEEETFQALEDFGCKSVGVTGHSLGGGIATLASFRIRTERELPVFPVYTFGAPRVGNPSFVHAYARAAYAQDISPPSWRVVHWRDPVALLFPREEFCKYEHQHQEIFYAENFTSYKECRMDIYEDQSCSNQFPLSLSHSHLHTILWGANIALNPENEKCIKPKEK